MEEQSDTPRTDALLDDIRTQKVATRYRYVRMVRAAKQFERERDEARALNAEWGKKAETWMASPEAAQRLQGYRELAQQVATAQNERDEARAEVAKLRVERDTLKAAAKKAEAALADIGDSDHEPTDDLAWCEQRAQEALPVVRFALAATEAP